MSVSVAVKKLKTKWPIIQERVKSLDLGQGMTLADFCRVHLRDVPPGDVMPVARALKRKGDIWIGIVEDVERVHRTKPEKVRRAHRPKKPELASVLAAITPDAFAFLGLNDPQALDRIARKMALDKGVSMEELQTAVEMVFAPSLWEALERRGLPEAPPVEGGVDIDGDGAEARVLRALARRGREGHDRSSLSLAIRPYMSAKVIASALVALEDQFLIMSCECIPHGIGRKREVYILAEHGLPVVDQQGRAFM